MSSKSSFFDRLQSKKEKVVHHHDNTTIVPRHTPEDQIESNKMLCLVDTILLGRDMDNYKISVVQTWMPLRCGYIAEY